jgi:hypothetical protein
MICLQCKSEITDIKYFAYKIWKPLDALHNHPDNIVTFCGPKCSLEWYKNRNQNENRK